jgi:hypothetical protein
MSDSRVIYRDNDEKRLETIEHAIIESTVMAKFQTCLYHDNMFKECIQIETSDNTITSFFFSLLHIYSIHLARSIDIIYVRYSIEQMST